MRYPGSGSVTWKRLIAMAIGWQGLGDTGCFSSFAFCSVLRRLSAELKTTLRRKELARFGVGAAGALIRQTGPLAGLTLASALQSILKSRI
jgi:hypothetical protein